MNSNWFKLVMKMTKVEYGKDLLLKGVPIIFNKGGAKLKIGENVTIKSSFLSNLVGLYSRTIIVTRAPGAEIEIGDNVGISGATIYARKKITIGENTCIGGNCKILDNDFHPIEAEARNQLLRDENGGDSDLVPSREIKIGKNCFIGCNSIILKGTVLGDGCVVGAGAVVCGKFEDKGSARKLERCVVYIFRKESTHRQNLYPVCMVQSLMWLWICDRAIPSDTLTARSSLLKIRSRC